MTNAPGTEILLLSLDQCCIILGVSAPTLRKAIRNQRLPTVQIGARMLVPVDGLRAWIAENSSVADGE